MPEGAQDLVDLIPLDPNKFCDPYITAKGEVRASVDLTRLETLWFNTGSLCNIECAHCYMESGPKKDDLVYLELAHVRKFLAEIKDGSLPTQEIGFTGGEPFMNPDLISMLDDVMVQGLCALVLTNAMQPLWNCRQTLLDLKSHRDTDGLKFRISVDHFTQSLHEKERGPNTWTPMERGLKWLSDNGFALSIAGRTLWNEDEIISRKGYQGLCDAWGLKINAFDPGQLVLFPEMDDVVDVPEITTACWDILDVRPDAQMCANSRMVVLRKGDKSPKVTPCTLLPYDSEFDLGTTLTDAHNTVQLNHPHCAKFCVLGGASCSS